MPRRRIGKILYFFLLASLLVSSFWLSIIIFKALVPRQQESLPAPPLTTKTEVIKPVTIQPPAQLEITAIAVRAIIKPVGLTVDGDMAIDGNINDVAWYDLGPRPGEVGSAVIAGHYGWKQGLPSVFNNLRTLAVGDRVSVYDANDKALSFIVRKTQSYDPAADATTVFQSDDGIAHLNLITCEGAWVSHQQTYSQRLVVFTDKEV